MKRFTRFSAIVVIFILILASCGVAITTILTLPSDSAPVSQLDNTEKAMTPQQEEVVKSASNYLNGNGFSKQYLTDWLISFEKFSPEDVAFAIDYLHPDWNQQAVLTGQTYLNGTGMSREGLIEQMSNSNGDKYTKAQALYAADHLLPR